MSGDVVGRGLLLAGAEEGVDAEVGLVVGMITEKRLKGLPPHLTQHLPTIFDKVDTNVPGQRAWHLSTWSGSWWAAGRTRPGASAWRWSPAVARSD